MAKFKFMNVLVAAALLAGFSSCSQDDEIVAGGEEAKNLGYASVSIKMPNGTATRADYGDGQEDAGTAAEYEIENATLYFVNTVTNTVAQINTLDMSNITGTSSNNVITYPAQNVALAQGTYRLYVVANGTAAGIVAGNAPSSEAALQEALPTTINTWATTGSLPMASRRSEASSYPITITAANTAINPFAAQVDLERTVAKITLKGSGSADSNNTFVFNTTNGESENIATVKINSYRMVNLHNTAFMFRHKSVNDFTLGSNPGYAYGDLLTGSEYIMDPRTVDKKFIVIDGEVSLPSDYTEWYETTDFTNVTSGTNALIIGYCQENIMHKDAQKKGYGTAVEFTASITPVASKIANSSFYTAGSDLFYYNGKFYVTYAEVKTVIDAAFSSTALPTWDGISTESTEGVAAISAMKTYGVTMFAEGKCTYQYYIKHMDNANSNVMGIMEFAIVRNNVYNVNVTGVSKLGKGITDPGTDPKEDIETTISLEVTLTVKPWIVRANDAVLGR